MRSETAVNSVPPGRLSSVSPRARCARVTVLALALAAFAPAYRTAHARQAPPSARAVHVAVEQIAREAKVFGVDSMTIVRQVTERFASANLSKSTRAKDSCAITVRVSRTIGGGDFALTVLMRRFDSGAKDMSVVRSARTAFMSSWSQMPHMVARMIDRQLDEFLGPSAPG